MKTTTHAAAHARHAFSAPAQTVFDAWLDPDLLARWMFSPEIQDEEVVDIQVDGRKGGSFHFVIRRGGQLFEYKGVYLDLRRPEQLIFTWLSENEPCKTLVSVTIESKGTGCEVTVVHELGDVADETIRRVEARWQAELGALSSTLN